MARVLEEHRPTRRRTAAAGDDRHPNPNPNPDPDPNLNLNPMIAQQN